MLQKIFIFVVAWVIHRYTTSLVCLSLVYTKGRWMKGRWMKRWPRSKTSTGMMVYTDLSLNLIKLIKVRIHQMAYEGKGIKYLINILSAKGDLLPSTFHSMDSYKVFRKILVPRYLHIKILTEKKNLYSGN